jgi:hypothetical protein
MRKKTSPRPLTGKIGITVHPKRNPSQVIGSDFLSGSRWNPFADLAQSVIHCMVGRVSSSDCHRI